MHYVKQFNINGVDTKQVACIELRGKPNAATEGYVGVLGIDIVSPFHEVYKCVAVNGSIYTWELLSSGMSIMSTTILGKGEETVMFQYVNLLTPSTYVVKPGDLILDKEGYLYQISALDSTHCVAKYTGIQIALYGKSAYDLAVDEGFVGDIDEWLAFLKGDKGDKGDPAELPHAGENGNWWIGDVDTHVPTLAPDGARIATGSYTGVHSSEYNAKTELTFNFKPSIVFIRRADTSYLKEQAILIRPMGTAFVTSYNGTSVAMSSTSVTWTENGVSFGSRSESDLNVSGVVYHYVALG